MFCSKKVDVVDVLLRNNLLPTTYNFTKPFSLSEDPKANFILFEIINYIQM